MSSQLALNGRRSPRYAVLDAPITLGLRREQPQTVPGVRRLSDVLRGFGLIGALGAEDAGRVPAPTAYLERRETESNVLNGAAASVYAVALAARVGELLSRGHFPLVLGGDCSVLLGVALALRRAGRFGLFFCDGHTDYWPPEQSQTGGLAGMDLWVVTGGSPHLFAEFAPRPLIEPRDVVLFGPRDARRRQQDKLPDPQAAGMQLFDLQKVRAIGAARAARQGVAALRARGVTQLWLHLDADVLNDAEMPAVDSRQPDGLTSDEAVEALREVLQSGLACGMTVTIYDPDRDPGGTAGRRLAWLLVQALRTGRDFE